MNGIENIANKIQAEADLKAEAIINEAAAQAKQITDAVAKRIVDDVVNAREVIRMRVEDVAQKAEQAAAMERRKLLAAERQALIGEAFDKALERLLSLPEEEYLALLVSLTEKAVFDGEGGEILLNPTDRELYGEQLVREINGYITTGKFASAKKLVTGAIERAFSGDLASISKLVENKEAFGAKKVALAQDTVNIVGGVIIRRDKIELNCALDSIIRMLSQESASIVFEALFPKGA